MTFRTIRTWFSVFTETIRKALSGSTSHFPFNKAQSSPYVYCCRTEFGATTSFKGIMVETNSFKLMASFLTASILMTLKLP